MYSNKKLFIMIVLIVVSLSLTETPYINTLFAGKIWIFYLLFLFYLFPPRNLTYIIVLTFISLVGYVEAVGSVNVPAPLLKNIILSAAAGVYEDAVIVCDTSGTR
mgnify:CR=1 FL=1